MAKSSEKTKRPVSCTHQSLIVLVERLILYTFFVGLWIFVQFPILNALLFREKYGLVIFPLSLAMVAGFRYRQGGRKEVFREFETVFTDLTFPIWFLYDTIAPSSSSPTITTAEWTTELLRQLATLSKYLVMYGPLSFGGVIMLVAPWALLLLQPMLYQPWFSLLPWLTLVYCTMMFCGIVTNACMHRFFSHASFATSRGMTFALGLLGCVGGQFGPLWWASNHRRHHKYCETELDVHCPAIHGFWYSHCGWIMDSQNFPIRREYVPKVGRDWPELMLLDVFCTNIQFVTFFAVARFLHWTGCVPAQADEPGFLLRQVVIGPEPGYVLDPQDIAAQYVDTALILGYALFLHFEFLINSWCHTWTRNENTAATQDSKTGGTTCVGLDSYWVGILNAGEGFHANHHQFPAEAQHGPHWYYDWSYAFIATLEGLGLVWNVVRPAAAAAKKKVT